MPASPIRKLVPLANEAIARGIKVYRLNIGQPDIPTPEIGLDAMRNLDRKILEYSPSEGLLSLRRKLKSYYERFHINVDVDDIIITTGGSEAVLFAFMATLQPDRLPLHTAGDGPAARHRETPRPVPVLRRSVP